MSWVDRFRVANEALGTAWGAVVDLATSPFDDDEESFAEITGKLGQLGIGTVNAVAQGALGGAGGLLWGLDKISENVVLEPLSTAVTAGSLAASSSWNADLFQGETWSRARDIADYRSFGQSVVVAATGTDPLDDAAIEEMKQGFLFNAVSGTIDAAANIFLDPTIVGGKVAAGAKAVRRGFGAGHRASDPWLQRQLAKHAKLGVGDIDPYDYAQSKAVDDFLDWAQKKNGRQIANHEAVKASPYSSVIAGLLQDTDKETGRLIIATAYGSKKAFDELAARRDDLAWRVARADNRTNFALQYEMSRAPRFVAAPVGGGKPKVSDPIQYKLFDADGKIRLDAAGGVGPVNVENAKQMVPALNAEAKRRAQDDWAKLKLPGMPPTSVKGAVAPDQSLSNFLTDIDRRQTKWFLSYQRELAQKAGRELDLLNAAIGSGGEGRGVWNSMINQVITGDKQLRKADKTLAYDWESRSRVAERIIQPKAYGLPVRVIQEMPFHVARSFSEQRPPSWIDPNRGDSHSAVAAWLNSIDVFDPRTKDIRLRMYMRATEPSAKAELMARMEAEAVQRMAAKYGLSEDAAKAIAERAVGERNSVVQQLRKKKDRTYGVTPGGEFPFDDFPVDGDGVPVVSRVFETQETNSIPLLDLDKYDRAFRRHAPTLRALDRGAATVGEFMDRAYDVFNPLWSFSVLMRFGYTVRTLTDDMLRIWASLGAMSIMGNIAAGARNMTSGGALKQRAKNIKTGLQRTAIGAIAAASPKDVADALRAQVDAMGRDIESVRRIGDTGWEYRGRQFRGAYQGRGEVYRQIVGGSYDAIARTSGEIIERLRSDYASWDVKNPADPDHLDSWVYAVNNQIGKSALGRRFLEGMTGAQVEHWLRYTAEGQQVRKKIGTKGKDAERLVGEAQAIVDQYVPILRDSDDPMMLRRLALEGKLDAKTLEQIFPDIDARPQVHGPTVDLNLAQGPVQQFMDSIVSTGFRWLSQIPTDKLMRHPTFKTIYQDSVRRQYDNLARQLGDEALVTGDDLAAMEHTAREMALKGVQSLLYDVGTRSNAAHAARFVTSFFAAWQDSLTKWSRLAMDKPHLLFIGSKVFEAPNEMNFGATEDEHGNRVPRIQVVDEQGRPVKPEDARVDGNERIIARLPAWLQKVIPGAEEFGAAAIPKSSLNLILQGTPWWLPGAGPLTQVAVSEIAKRQPNIKNVYEWAIPFGPTTVSDVMLPGWLKQAVKRGDGIDDPAYAYTYLQIAQTEEMRIRAGMRDRPSPVEFAKEIQRRTDAAFAIRSFVRFFMPFTAELQSPYQFYIDKYRQMAEVHGDQADEMFYERYGDDLYLFTTALSKNNVGLKATESAWSASKKYADLIADNPEYGALIVGPDMNTGPFNQYIHEAQFKQRVKPGTSLTARERRSPLEALADNDRKLGWLKFQRYMGLVTGMEESGGYTDAQLTAARRAVVEFIGEEHKEWLSDYQQSDRSKIPNRIKFFEDLVAEPRLVNNPMRTDLRVLAEYLAVRRQYVAHLEALKKAGVPHTLGAEANAALKAEWQRVTRALAASDTRFSDLYWRYLSHDELQV